MTISNTLDNQTFLKRTFQDLLKVSLDSSKQGLRNFFFVLKFFFQIRIFKAIRTIEVQWYNLFGK
ncbi:hypothetical protein DRF60_07905 [Chryseobacterium elymi]|uniref:Uncharacterized protein n=1 Tax=Chryseobacterium elymi TaxID=395936 RepID=A0A3D9DMH9_9FLAO|nr:hypothetical protein DRF60_07905 [Chryseobacterium elymi]